MRNKYRRYREILKIVEHQKVRRKKREDTGFIFLK